jgi:cellulose synthase/poly-beta-1,6-N-acetylglucosamine synthase-like glycosyltransferase
MIPFSVVRVAFDSIEWSLILYVSVSNAFYLLMMVLGFFALRRHRAQQNPEARAVLLNSPLLPEVSIIVPAYNEALTIAQSVRSLLNLNYPHHEVIVVNDGSKDATLEVLIEQFHLYKSTCRSGAALTQPVRALYRSRDPIRLTVVDKENGGKADALNAGLNVARSPLVSAVDSDSLMEDDALLHIVEPFVENPGKVLACGGIIRVVNGCTVEHGRITRISTPRRLLPLFQTLEYLRAFLGGRVAFSFLNSLLLISGAFGVFDREALLEVGGFSTDTVGEDLEMVVRLHRRWREKKAPYCIAFVPEPVCWTEVPESWTMLHRQRNRWQRGTVETMLAHERMVFSPAFGGVGLFAMPYFVIFEMFGPGAELGGYLLTVAGLLSGMASWQTAGIFFVVSVLFGILLSMSAVVLEEFTMRRYPSVFDLGRLLGASVLENFGYRQLLTLWRVQGVWDALRGKKGWGAMERRGFQGHAPAT